MGGDLSEALVYGAAHGDDVDGGCIGDGDP